MSPAPHLLNAFLLTVVLIILFRDVAARAGLVDEPDHVRKLHRGGVPVVGGLAIFLGYAVASAFLGAGSRAPVHVLAGLGALVVIGALDDRFGLRAGTRLGLQTAAALVMIWPIATSTGWLGGEFGEARTLPAIVAAPLGLVFVVGLANAFNMIDGLDGLAGGVAACALFWLALTAMTLGREDAILGALPLLFSVLGFLVFNLRHRWRAAASVFMGDAGSLTLGAAVAYFSLSLATDGETRVAPMTPLLWISALPAIETLSLIVRRARAGQSPMSGDRRHLHHLLVDAGVSPKNAAAILITVCGALGAVGYAAAIFHVGDGPLLGGLAALVAIHSLAVSKGPAWLELRRRRTKDAGAKTVQATMSIAERRTATATGLSAAIVPPRETDEAR